MSWLAFTQNHTESRMQRRAARNQFSTVDTHAPHKIKQLGKCTLGHILHYILQNLRRIHQPD